MVEWIVEKEPVGYEDAVTAMEDRVAAIRAGDAPELVWFLEHEPLYTGGTSAREDDLLEARFPVHRTGRGGEYTYHGPGQRVAYVMLNLRVRQSVPDIKKYVWSLEEWVIRSLAVFGVTGERRAGRVGIWVVTPKGEKKVAAIGVRIRHWVTYHGVAVNVDPDLSHFSGIVPCGISEYGVTSLRDLGLDVTMAEWDAAFRAVFGEVFGEAFNPQRGG
ncbi:MAG: lipoyl(octanoyl) transferase LipB [Alphaproteobacteria bacterium]|nr:lipoyl(octanoyl) transferase LipB [Alphaproteobacteria bacterium]